MPPLAVAAIGAAATVGGAMLSNSAQKKATRAATRESEANRTANNALVEGNRQFAFNALDPYSQGGLRAQNALQGMLFGGSTAPGMGPMPGGVTSAMKPGATGTMPDRPDLMVPGAQPNALAGPSGGQMVDWNGYLNDPMNADARADYNQNHAGEDIAAYGAGHWQRDGGRRALDPYAVSAEQQQAMAQSPWDQFRNSTNYQFRLNEGFKGLNLGLANNGYSDSGAAVKEAIKYGQNFASNEVGNYMNLLAGQQQIGMGAASAMVGSNNQATNALMSNNTANAGVQANGALMRGQQQGQLYGTIAGAIGNVAGAVGGMGGGGSSYSFGGSGGSIPRFGG